MEGQGQEALNIKPGFAVDVSEEENNSPTKATLDPLQPPTRSLDEVEVILGYNFKNKCLLEEAFTHSSYNKDSEAEKCFSYERLGYLGDAVLHLLVTKEQFFLYPDLSPGRLTRLRSANVDTEKLARVAIKQGLHHYLRHKKPLLEQQISEFRRDILEYPLRSNGLIDAPKALADIVESTIGALFVDSDSDFDAVWKVFRSLLEPIIDPDTIKTHPVTELHEVCQKMNLKVEFVDLWNESMAFNVLIDNQLVGRGICGTKKEIAHNRAAQNALDNIGSILSINKKFPLELDWNRLLPSRDDEPPSMLIVKPSSDSLSQPRKPSDLGLDQPFPLADDLERFNDRGLMELLQRKKSTLETTGPRLPDKGEKLRALIKHYEEELARRKRRRLDKEVDEIEKPRPDTSSSTVESTEIDGLKVKFGANREPDDLMSSGKRLKGISNGLRQENTSSQAQSPSSFTSCFNNKMEDTDCQVTNAFNKELSLFKHCDNHKMRHNGNLSQKEGKRDQSSLRQLPFECPSNISRCKTPSDDKSCRAASTLSLQSIGKKLSGCFRKFRKDAFQAVQSDGSRSRKGQPIVLDDEDELYILEKTDEEDKLVEWKEAKIYYPSSDDPEAVEICYTDIDCLGPGGYLTSTIMNFYIRYLQQQASRTNKSVTDYLFLNTYFYKKLKDAVYYKQSDTETFFVKFRRWWKGVNIFQKAYVLIPIHEDLHWSLAIICIPDKEDESGPIILHLDSLGLHSSRSVFDNVRRYLIEEWRYLDRESVYSDIPIADGIWKNLDCKIEDRIITVPQQKNDYDCGLFVLYFIKRFIEEAPKRLKKKDLAMFGKQWFKPEEASNLRVRIRTLLKIEFRNSRKQNAIPTECVVTIGDA